LLVRVYNGFEAIRNIYLEYRRELEKYREEVGKSINNDVKIIFKKKSIRRGGIHEIYFSKPKIVFPKRLSDKLKGIIKTSIPPLPKFPLEQLKCEVVGSDIFLEYGAFRKLKSYFEGYRVEPLYVDVKKILSLTCKLSKSFIEKLERETGIKPKWIPLISSRILSEVSKEVEISENDVKDAILYAHDVGEALIERGESGELWFNVEFSCKTVRE